MFTHICLNDSLPLIIRYIYPKSRIDKAKFPGNEKTEGTLLIMWPNLLRTNKG